MATGDPIDRAYLDLDATQVYCSSIEITWDDGQDWVEEMSRSNEPAGLAGGNIKCDIACEVNMKEDEEADVDFYKLFKDRTNIPIIVEYESGRKFTWGKGRLVGPSISGGTGEKAGWSFTLKCHECVVSN